MGCGRRVRHTVFLVSERLKNTWIVSSQIKVANLRLGLGFASYLVLLKRGQAPKRLQCEASVK
jgi:hypothetical protein